MNQTFDDFVRKIETAVATIQHEPALLQRVSDVMRELVASDDWLPPAFTKTHPIYYQQYLLHRGARFSIVSFVWGPGQSTPIHDHTVWGVIGMLRGRESSQAYMRRSDGIVLRGEPETLEPGQVVSFSPLTGDIHRVWNASEDRESIGIHVYGADIGTVKRHVYDPQTGAAKEFVSGYANVTREL